MCTPRPPGAVSTALGLLCCPRTQAPGEQGQLCQQEAPRFGAPHIRWGNGIHPEGPRPPAHELAVLAPRPNTPRGERGMSPGPISSPTKSRPGLLGSLREPWLLRSNLELGCSLVGTGIVLMVSSRLPYGSWWFPQESPPPSAQLPHWVLRGLELCSVCQMCQAAHTVA